MDLKILSLGFFGHQNAGDDLLRASLEYIFREHRVTFSSLEPSIQAMNEYDLIVIGGGSLWPDFKFFRRPISELRRLKTPVCILGVSAKRDDRSIFKSTKFLINNAKFFHVRDSTTKELLGAENILVGADLFWWAPWDVPELSEPKLVFRNADDLLMGYDLSKRVAIAFRSDKTISWDPLRLISVVRSYGFDPIPFPFYFGSVKHDGKAEINDSAFLSKILGGPLMTHWSILPAVTSDIVLAMRYHAILVSIRLGRVVIGLDCHPKISAFYKEFELSELCVRPDDPLALDMAMRRVVEDYPKYRNRVLEIRDILECKGREDYERFGAIIDSVQPKKPNWFSGCKKLFT